MSIVSKVKTFFALDDEEYEYEEVCNDIGGNFHVVCFM